MSVLTGKITSQLKQIIPCPFFAEIMDEGRTVAGSICSAGVEGNSLPIAWESDCSARETELEGHGHNVQLLKKECVGVDESEYHCNPSNQQYLSVVFRVLRACGTRRQCRISMLRRVLWQKRWYTPRWETNGW